MKCRTICLIVVAVIIAFSLQGCIGGRVRPPTFGKEATVLINPVFEDFSPGSNYYEATGEEKDKILNWYKQIKIIEVVDNPAVPTEPPVPSMLIFTGELPEHVEKFAGLTDISGQHFYLCTEIEGNAIIYSCQQDDIKAMFNQMRGEYKPNTTP
jgi:hypothetical protein